MLLSPCTVHLGLLRCSSPRSPIHVERASSPLLGCRRARGCGRGVLPRRPAASRWYGGRTPPLHATHAGPALGHGAFAVGGGGGRGGGAAGATVLTHSQGGGLRGGQGGAPRGGVHGPAARPAAQHRAAGRRGVPVRSQRPAAHPGPGPGKRNLSKMHPAATEPDRL